MQVSKDIKYADKQPIVPWGPRFAISIKRPSAHLTVPFVYYFCYYV